LTGAWARRSGSRCRQGKAPLPLKLHKLRELQAAPEAPLRAELYSADQMERHGKALASGHELDPGRRPGRGRDRLLARLTQNESALVAAGELPPSDPIIRRVDDRREHLIELRIP